MNLFTKFSKLTMLCALGLFLCTCQKEQAIYDVESEMETVQLKSATTSDYLIDLIETINTLIPDGAKLYWLHNSRFPILKDEHIVFTATLTRSGWSIVPLKIWKQPLDLKPES